MNRPHFAVILLLFLLTSFPRHAMGFSCRLDKVSKTSSRLTDPLDSIRAYAASIGTKDVGMDRERLIQTLRIDPHYTWIANDLLAGNVSFATNHSEEVRERILKSGFQNWFESGHTKTVDESYREDRTTVEAACCGMSLKDYKKVPPSKRMIYGYLAPLVGGALQREKEVQTYGKDTYVFKKGRLEDRTTWMLGDSFDQQLKVSKNGKVRMPNKLSRYLPWEDRDLLLPRLRNSSPNYKPETLKVLDWSSWVDLPNGKHFQYGNDLNHGYIELQFWGKVTLDDVESFIFAGTPPSGRFLKELRKRGVRIYHNDGKRDVLWTQDQKGPQVRE